MSNEKYLSILQEIKEEKTSLEDSKPNDKVLIIDGLNTFIRVFSVIPTLNDDGVHIGGIVGFLKSIGYVIHLFNPTAVALSGVFPFNYRNELNENALPSGLYPHMIDDFMYRRCWISESRGNEITQLSPELYIGSTRCSTQVKAI